MDKARILFIPIHPPFIIKAPPEGGPFLVLYTMGFYVSLRFQQIQTEFRLLHFSFVYFTGTIHVSTDYMQYRVR